MTSARKRWQISEQEAKRLFGVRNDLADFKTVSAEFNTDPDSITTFGVTRFQMLKGPLAVKSWIARAGLERCKMKDATCLLTVGDQQDGCFVAGKYKNYWLRPIK